LHSDTVSRRVPAPPGTRRTVRVKRAAFGLTPGQLIKAQVTDRVTNQIQAVSDGRQVWVGRVSLIRQHLSILTPYGVYEIAAHECELLDLLLEVEP